MIERHRSLRPPAAGGLWIPRRAAAGGLTLALAFSTIAILCANAEETVADKGARVYDKYCATCHGDDLENNSGVAFDLRRLKADEHPRFVNSVLHGKKVMPAWQGVLTSEQIEELWAYIRANAYQQ
jgi:mono/diheme cytochrome c family protein